MERNWTLGRRRWDTTNIALLMTAGRWFSINASFDVRTGDHAYWYVNFERPYVRTVEGIDTLDLLLDLVVQPDLTWTWKDEYAHALRLGIITPAAAIDTARAHVLALVESAAPPFTGDWAGWRPSPAWPTPTLPTTD